MGDERADSRTPEKDFGLHPNDHREANNDHLTTSPASANATQRIPEATYAGNRNSIKRGVASAIGAPLVEQETPRPPSAVLPAYLLA